MTRNAGPRGRAKPARHELYARLGLTALATEKDAKTAHSELVRFLESAPESVRNWAQSEIAAADEAYALLSDPATAPATGRSPFLKQLAVVAVVLALAVGIGIGVYNMGGGESVPKAPEAGAVQKQKLTRAEQAKVARLMTNVRANSKDVPALIRLGNAFFQAGDYRAAGGWMSRAVKLEPRNVTARLALGAAQFNLGGDADARRQWLRVVELDPKNVEAYYDLGFLYMSEEPPDVASAKKAWRKVAEIAPGSAAAKTVADHLQRLKDSRAPNGSASPAAPSLGVGK